MNPYKLRRHMVSHTNVREFQCDICNRYFARMESRDKHLQTHLQERQHACIHCDKRFMSRSGLRNHIGIHTGEHNFKCGLCPLSFLYSSSAAKHRRTHQLVDGSGYRCQICLLTFNHFNLLRAHMNNDHMAAVSNFA